MKTFLHSLLLIPLAFTAVACEEPIDLDDEAAIMALAEDELDEDLDFADAENADEDFSPDEYDFGIEPDDEPTHHDAGPSDLDNGPRPTHGDIDDFGIEPQPTHEPGDTVPQDLGCEIGDGGPLMAEGDLDDLTRPIGGDPEDIDDLVDAPDDDDSTDDLSWGEPEGDPDPGDTYRM